MIIRDFGGQVPALDGRALPENRAQLARDLRLGYMRLEPLAVNQAAGVTLGASTQTMYLYNRDANAGNGFWLEWDTAVDVLESPIADDVHGRVYWAGDGPPKMSVANIITSAPPYPANSYLLGVPAPADTATLVVAVGADPDALAQSVAYAVTYVSAYGEEGPPTNATAIVDRPDGHLVTLSNIPAAPTGNYNIATKRIYRSSGGDYLLVAEIAVATTTYADTVSDNNLGRAMDSLDYVAPNTGMVGLAQHPSGYMVGYFDNVLCFSDAYLPHAWPTGYRLTTKRPITGIAITSAGIVVGTEDKPYLCAGSSPDAMQLLEIDTPNACISARGMVDMGEYVLYPSPDGLVAAGGMDSRVMTDKLFTRKQWQALTPSAIHAYRYDSKYLAFHPGGAFILDPATGDVSTLTDTADTALYDAIRDTLYLSNAGVLSSFDSGATLRTGLWRSKVWRTAKIPYAAVRVDADDYPVTVRVYGDDALIATLGITHDRAIRLPTSNRYGRAYLEIESSTKVHSVAIATSIAGLQS